MLDSDKGEGMDTWEYSLFSQVQQVSVQAGAGMLVQRALASSYKQGTN